MTAEDELRTAPGGGADSLATQIAMGAHPDMANDARDYLKKQSRLADLQIETLEKQDEFEVSHLRWRRVRDQMTGALQFVAVAFGVALVAVIVIAVVDASRDDGLVIEAFSVPSDFSSRGLTGNVVASQLLDKLQGFTRATVSNRAPSSYANNWGDDIKVQIPETGVSIGDLNRSLRSWLGHQTRITGEIWHTPTGIAVTARVGVDESATFEGSEADLDKLIQKAAESVYRATQPYRYGVYLTSVGRTKEAEAVYDNLIAFGSPLDKVWALIGISNVYHPRGDFESERRALEQAIRLRPGLFITHTNLSGLDGVLGHDEEAFLEQREGVKQVDRGREPDVNDAVWPLDILVAKAALANDIGDFPAQIAFDRDAERLPEFGGNVEGSRNGDIQAYGALHDEGAIRRAIDEEPPSTDAPTLIRREAVIALAELSLGKPDRDLADRGKFESGLAKLGLLGVEIEKTVVWPNTAYALAMKHEFSEAHALIDKTPSDCVNCLRLRGRIDALEQKWTAAAYWFARAARASPSLPFAFTDWGEMLVSAQDYDGAIALLAHANQLSPHFADPLVFWGEALMAQHRADLALDRFKEAVRYAPAWPRLRHDLALAEKSAP